MIEFVDLTEQTITPLVRLKVVGVGGAGGNAVNSMVDAHLENVEFIAANTDAQALGNARAQTVIQLGSKLTKGLGSGANPEVGRKATEEDLPLVMEKLAEADMVFLVAGLGGGTGSGGTPVVAKALRERNILTVAVVTKPFVFEGKRRMKVAETAIEQLRETVDTLIVIPNQKLTCETEKGISLLNAFEVINDFTAQFIRSVASIITRHGHINVDFADIQTIMRSMGTAVMGTGTASGEHRAEEATIAAISSPFLEEQGIRGAQGVLLNITGSSSLGLHEVSAAAGLVYEQADEDANIVLGSVIDESMGDKVSVTIIATGFNEALRTAPVKTTPAVALKQPIVSPVLEQQVVREMPPLPEPLVKPIELRVMEQKLPEPPVIQEASALPADPLEIPAIMRAPSNAEHNDIVQ